MNVKPIRTKRDHAAALRRIERLMDATKREDLDELDVLATLVGAYEDKHFPIPAADPIDVLKFYMDQRGLRQVDLAPLLGGRSRVSEILGRRRSLTLQMIRRLSKKLRIPAGALVGI